MCLKAGNCIRLYNQEGKHVLSLVACPSGVDICTPDGDVMYCDSQQDLGEVLEHLKDSQRPIEQMCRQLPLAK
jgi:hypothetical protein